MVTLLQISEPPRLTLTLHLLCQQFWWPSMTRDASTYIAACPVCAREKSSHQTEVPNSHPGCGRPALLLG